MERRHAALSIELGRLLAEESGIGLVAGYAFFSAPYEDVRLKGK
jgi:hypothetical protein